MARTLIGWTWQSADIDLCADSRPYENAEEILAFPNVVKHTPERCMTEITDDLDDMYDAYCEGQRPPMNWTQEGEVDEPPTFTCQYDEYRMFAIRPVYLED